jgi:hypothetical protein
VGSRHGLWAVLLVFIDERKKDRRKKEKHLLTINTHNKKKPRNNLINGQLGSDLSIIEDPKKYVIIVTCIKQINREACAQQWTPPIRTGPAWWIMARSPYV